MKNVITGIQIGILKKVLLYICNHQGLNAFDQIIDGRKKAMVKITLLIRDSKNK